VAKYLGCTSGVAPTLKSTLSEEQGSAVVAAAYTRLKSLKLTPIKTKLHCSTIGLKLVAESQSGEAEEILENGSQSVLTPFSFCVLLATTSSWPLQCARVDRGQFAACESVPSPSRPHERFAAVD
jgi:hypothetical protein